MIMSNASTFISDLQRRVQRATLIIPVLIGSTVSCLFRRPGVNHQKKKRKKREKKNKQRAWNWCRGITCHYSRTSVYCGCWLWAEWKWGAGCEGCHVACHIHMQCAKHKRLKQQKHYYWDSPRLCLLFSSRVVLAQSFSKGKGQLHLLLTYSNECDGVRAAHFILLKRCVSKAVSRSRVSWYN